MKLGDPVTLTETTPDAIDIRRAFMLSNSSPGRVSKSAQPYPNLQQGRWSYLAGLGTMFCNWIIQAGLGSRSKRSHDPAMFVSYTPLSSLVERHENCR